MLPVSIVRSVQPKILFETISEVKQAIANKVHENNWHYILLNNVDSFVVLILNVYVFSASKE